MQLRFPFHRLIPVLLLGVPSVFAQETDTSGVGLDKPAAPSVQAKIHEWVTTQQILSKEEANWKEEKETFTHLNELRRQELEQLKEFTKASRDRASELDEQLAGFSEERELLKAWRRNLQTQVSEWEEQIMKSSNAFPPPLREKVEESLLRIEAEDSERPLQQRTRDVLVISQALLDFQNSFSVDAETREIEGETRSIDVLYLGLSQAWYVDASGRFSGYGIPAPDGWKWTVDNSIAATVREAIEIRERRAPPALVKLPIHQEVAK